MGGGTRRTSDAGGRVGAARSGGNSTRNTAAPPRHSWLSLCVPDDTPPAVPWLLCLSP